MTVFTLNAVGQNISAITINTKMKILFFKKGKKKTSKANHNFFI